MSAEALRLWLTDDLPANPAQLRRISEQAKRWNRWPGRKTSTTSQAFNSALKRAELLVANVRP